MPKSAGRGRPARKGPKSEKLIAYLNPGVEEEALVLAHVRAGGPRHQERLRRLLVAGVRAVLAGAADAPPPLARPAAATDEPTDDGPGYAERLMESLLFGDDGDDRAAAAPPEPDRAPEPVIPAPPRAAASAPPHMVGEPGASPVPGRSAKAIAGLL